MDVEVIQTCRGTHYHNLWWLNIKEWQVDCAIQFYLYWDMLQDEAGKVSCLIEEAIIKYRWIAWFTMGPHAIHIQARHEDKKKWLTALYKILDEELDSIIDEWLE